MVGASGGVFGRDAELAALDDVLAIAQEQLALLTIEGEPGIGKTTLWREALRRAEDAGARVLTTRATEAEAALSFAGLGDLFGSMSEAAVEELPEPQRLAIRAALQRVSAPEHGIDELALCAAVLSLVRRLARDGPLLIAVDDAQWLDTPSARALSYAVRRLDADRVAVLTTVRTGTGRPATFEAAADRGRRRTVRLGPLTVAALHEVIKQHTRRSLPRPVVVHLADACGGNPLYALEVVAELGDGALEAGRIPVPASLMELVAARVERLPEATRSALLTAALLSRPSTGSVDVSALEPARRAGIVHIEAGQIRFVHPLFSSAIQQHADDAERRQAHRALAAVLPDPEERAHHAALGAAAADVRIAEELDAAAARARSRGAPARAAELFELARDATPRADALSRGSRLVSAAAAWFDAGDLTRAETMLNDALAAELAPSRRAQAFELLGQLHLRRHSYREALALALQGLESASEDPALTADLEMDVSFYSANSGDIPGALEHVQRAMSAAEHAGFQGLLADALATETIVRFMAGFGIDWDGIQRARALEDPLRPRAWQMNPAFIHGNLLLYSGQPQAARDVLGKLHEESRERGEESPLPYSCFWLVWACLWQGDLAGARRYVDEARQTSALLDDAGARAMALTSSALVNAYGGASATARREAGEAVRLFQDLGWVFGAVYALWPLGHAELVTGHPEAVDAVLGGLAAQLTSMPGGDPGIVVFLGDEIEALIELGQHERADALLTWLETRAATVDRSLARAVAARCRALLWSSLGDNDAALRAAEEALRQHARTEIPLERARTLLAKGRIHRRRKEKRPAELALAEALSTFQALGAEEWAAKVRREIARLGRRPATTDELSPTELRVAELAVAGLTNSEIAERAFLTTKSVEGNLTRAYRKLGIRSRGGLARALEAAQRPEAARGTSETIS